MCAAMPMASVINMPVASTAMKSFAVMPGFMALLRPTATHEARCGVPVPQNLQIVSTVASQTWLRRQGSCKAVHGAKDMNMNEKQSNTPSAARRAGTRRRRLALWVLAISALAVTAGVGARQFLQKDAQAGYR